MTTLEGPRCAAWAREVGLDPAGTAPRTDVFVLVEHPLPWPSAISDDPFLAEIERVAREAAGPERTVRVQALAVDAPTTVRKVVVFATGRGPVRGYGRLEGEGRADERVTIVSTLVAADPPPPTRGGVTDVLVCTHGTRDSCCGSLGTRLWQTAERRGVHLWRTSHTGGHRFAPTAITFPDGCYWAFLDPASLQGIVDQTLAPDLAVTHLRGCAAFSPVVQVADRAIFASEGWDWLACARFGEQRGPRRVEICFETAARVRGGYDVCVENPRQMPVPDCGHLPGPESKAQVEWAVTRVQAWS